jgi:hypothetical protein
MRPCLRTISKTLHQIVSIYRLVQLNSAVITWSGSITDFRDCITDNGPAALCVNFDGGCPAAGVEALLLWELKHYSYEGVTHSQFPYNFIIQLYVRAVFSQDVS